MELKSLATTFMRIGKQLLMATNKNVTNRQIPAFMHTSCVKRDLMEFFEDKKHWAAQEIRVGRAWKLDELRIKSNEDLHKLWYVLLKEKNMLLTMEHYCKEHYILFPNPERIDKVKISMKNLEQTVRERNRAYHLLETGQDGERPKKYVRNQLGLFNTYKQCEHVIPKHWNAKWREHPMHIFHHDGSRAVTKFLKKYREVKYNRQHFNRACQIREARTLYKRFGDRLNIEALKEKLPMIKNMEKIFRKKHSRGHRENEF